MIKKNLELKYYEIVDLINALTELDNSACSSYTVTEITRQSKKLISENLRVNKIKLNQVANKLNTSTDKILIYLQQ